MNIKEKPDNIITILLLFHCFILFFDDAFKNRGDSHVSHPPPKRFMKAPVAVMDGVVEERVGAGGLNKSAGEVKAEMMFRARAHSQKSHKLLSEIHYNAHLSNANAPHTAHAGMAEGLRVI